jgi:hypothetical protein
MGSGVMRKVIAGCRVTQWSPRSLLGDSETQAGPHGGKSREVMIGARIGTLLYGTGGEGTGWSRQQVAGHGAMRTGGACVRRGRTGGGRVSGGV